MLEEDINQKLVESRILQTNLTEKMGKAGVLNTTVCAARACLPVVTLDRVQLHLLFRKLHVLV